MAEPFFNVVTCQLTKIAKAEGKSIPLFSDRMVCEVEVKVFIMQWYRRWQQGKTLPYDELVGRT